MAIDLNKKLGERKLTYPTKTAINFIRNEKAEKKPALIGLFVFLLFLALFVKFGIVDPLNRVKEAEKAYKLMDAQLDTYRQ